MAKIKSNVTTITLESGVEQVVEFEMGYPYFQIENLSKNTIYVSTLPNIIAEADGVYSISSKSKLTVGSGSDMTKLYFGGEGKVQVIASYDAVSRFKLAPKGGDISYNDLLDKPANATTEKDGFMSAGDKKIVAGVSNENLLINPDFVINQRGETVYTQIGYTVDRWRMFGGEVRPIDGGGVNIKVTGSYASIFQLIPIEQIDTARSFVLSISIDGVVYSGTVNEVNNTEQGFLPFGPGGGRIIIRTNTSNNTLTFQFYIMNDCTVNWAKLEYGTVPTPFIKPDPSTEILKCKKYFRTLSRGTMAVVTPINSQPFIHIICPNFDVPLRTADNSQIHITFQPNALTFTNLTRSSWVFDPGLVTEDAVVTLVSKNITDKGSCYIAVQGDFGNLTADDIGSVLSLGADDAVLIDAEIY